MIEKKTLCSTHDLTVGYGKKKIVENISFSLHAGEIIALIGPNGCGKSTLLKTLTRELPPISGDIHLGEKDISDCNVKEIAMRLSIVTTKRIHPGMMTCQEVVETGRYPYTGRMGFLTQSDRAIVQKAMEDTNTTEFATADFETVSDGQRQRVMLARALCKEPKVLLLDEPTTFLDIRYKLEFFDALKRMAAQRGIGVIVSLHELSYVEELADTVICIKDHRVHRMGIPQEVMNPAYVSELFGVSKALFERYERPEEQFIQKGGKKLRLGYTTGSCAAAGAFAAGAMLLSGERYENISLTAPDGRNLHVPVAKVKKMEESRATAVVIKDAGDDHDVTDGIEIVTSVTLTEKDIVILGGEGVGTVTKDGLNQPIGKPAINDGPRQMITAALKHMAEECGYTGGFEVTISVPKGVEIAQKTFNARLGIEGGISILGSTGIVEPMSERALLETIRAEISVKTKEGQNVLLFTPGNYGRDFAKDAYGIDIETGIKCSNFIGEAIDMASVYGVKRILLIGHIGKLVKLGSGIFQTHSKTADGRMETLAVCAIEAECPTEVVKKLLSFQTTEAAIDYMEETGCLKEVMGCLMKRINRNLEMRCGCLTPQSRMQENLSCENRQGDDKQQKLQKPQKIQIEAILFSCEKGELGRTTGAGDLLREIAQAFR